MGLMRCPLEKQGGREEESQQRGGGEPFPCVILFGSESLRIKKQKSFLRARKVHLHVPRSPPPGTPSLSSS